MSAMHTFGKYSGLNKKKMTSAKQIGVQPTAVARRKCNLTGRKRLASGRPPKNAIKEANKHNYTQFGKLPKRRKHDISVAVNKNIPN